MAKREPPLPPEPPVGTVLETRDEWDTYRIERTDLGWHIQYRPGEDEFGQRLSSFMGKGISWQAAWTAWGPPSGVQPFRTVSPDEPPLPTRPEYAVAPTPVDLASPINTTTSTPPGVGGGVAMSSVEEAKAGIAEAKDATETATPTVQQLIDQIEQADQHLTNAAEGSDQAEYGEAKAALAQVKQQAEELQQALNAVPGQLDGIRL